MLIPQSVFVENICMSKRLSKHPRNELVYFLTKGIPLAKQVENKKAPIHKANKIIFSNFLRDRRRENIQGIEEEKTFLKTTKSPEVYEEPLTPHQTPFII